MESTVIIRNRDGSSNTWRCREIGLDRLPIDESHSSLGEAYLFWSDFIHPAAAFEFETDRRLSVRPGETAAPNPSLTAAFRVDCRSKNPFDFRIGLPAKAENGVPVRALNPDYIRRIVALDFNYAKACRQPLYQYIYQQIDGTAQECYRLLLPILGDTNDVAEIYGFCRPRAASGPVRATQTQDKDSIRDR